MHDTIDLDAMFMNPVIAAREAARCDALANTFADQAARPDGINPAVAQQIADGYRARAIRLRQIATNTAAHRHRA